jgi:8-oxo-dGTP pyrophosphatase MutT (NUDIX family)
MSIPNTVNSALFTVSQKALLRDETGRILMLEKTGKNHWDLPGGKIDQGEEMEDALRREIQEETGLSKVSIHDVFHVGCRGFEEAGKADRVLVFYLCKTDEPFDGIQLSHEHTRWKLLSFDEIQDEATYEIHPVVRAALNKIQTSEPR